MPGIIKPEDIFDFQGYHAQLQALDDAGADWAQHTLAWLQRIRAAYQEAARQLAPLKEDLAKLSVTKDGADRQLVDYIQKIGQVGAKLEVARKAEKDLTEAQQLNGQVVTELTAKLASLFQRYQALDPTQKDYQKQQKAILREVNTLTRAIDAQSRTLKIAKTAADAAEGSYQHLSKQTTDLKNQLKQLPGAFDLITGKINSHNKAAVEMLARIQANEKALRQADQAMGNYQRNVGNYTSAFSGFSSSLLSSAGQLIGISSVFEAISKTIQITADMERIDAGLRAVSRDTEDFNRSQQFLIDTSDELGLRYDSLVKSYKLLKAATKDTSLEGKSTDNIFHALVNSGAKLQLSNEEVGGSLLAITQIVSKGQVKLEELQNQLGEHLPGALKIMAEATGLTETEMRKMLEKGQLLAVDVLPKFAKKLDEIYGGDAQEKVNTMSAGWNRMTNATQLFIASFNENKKVSTFFGTIQSGIASVLNDLTTLVKSDQWGAFIGFFTGNAAGAMATASGIRAANNASAQQEQKFRSLPADERQKLVNAADEKQLKIQKELNALIDKSPTEDVTKQELVLQKELNKAKERYNFLVKTNNDQVAQDARTEVAKIKEKKEADAAKAEQDVKDRKKAQAELDRKTTDSLGVSRSVTGEKLAGLDANRQDGLISEKEFIEQRKTLTIAGIEERQAILEKAGKQETDDYKKLNKEKLDAETQYKRDSLKLALSDSKTATAGALSDLGVDKEKGLVSEIEYAEKKHAITIAGINEQMAILTKAGQSESQLAKNLNKEKLDADQAYFRERLKAEEKAWNEELQQTKEAVKAVNATLGADYEEKLQALDRYYTEKQNKVRLDVKKGKLTPTEGEAQLYALQLAQLQESLRVTEETYHKDSDLSKGLYESKIEQLKNYRDYAMLNAQEMEAANKTIAELEKARDAEQLELKKKFNKEQAENGMQQSDLETDHELKNIDKAKQKRDELLKLGADFASKLGETTFALVSGNYERESQQLEAQHDNELKLAGDNADAKQKIEENYAKRKAELARKQAIADREQALFNIALSTAMGVASVLSTGGGTHYADLGISAGILTAFVIATGALEAAAVLAKPLPAYKDGKLATDTYSGLALAGEAGAELLVDREGYSQLFDKPTLFTTQPGDRVFTASETAALVASWRTPGPGDSWQQAIQWNQQTADTLQRSRQAGAQLSVQQAMATAPAAMTPRQFQEAFLAAWEQAPRQETHIDFEGMKEGIRRHLHWHERVEKRNRFW